LDASRTLEQWLDWQSQLHPSHIELGLERVSSVFGRLKLAPLRRVITVAGTNGKGTTVAAYESWLHARGFKVASYTSPHIQKYNERVRLGRKSVSDASLCEAFTQVDAARGETTLTYFEFGTLAALVLIAQYQPDFAILEVGLGGRLDAVNIIDANLAHITAIGLDHQAWLGDDRETIGREKAGILRDGGLAVCSDPQVPESVLQTAAQLHCNLLLPGRDYTLQRLENDRFSWRRNTHDLVIDQPLVGSHQAENFAGVLAGLDALGLLAGLDSESINNGFGSFQLAGRIQSIKLRGSHLQLVVDVGHNPMAARAIASYLASRKGHRKVTFMLGMLDDKDVAGFVHELSSWVDQWWLVSLPGERGLQASQLYQRGQAYFAHHRLFDSVADGLSEALSSAHNDDILFVAGSFLTVEAVFNSPGVTLS
jgi:dihydrofolate synthase/folylpolyglutamate synthase